MAAVAVACGVGARVLSMTKPWAQQRCHLCHTPYHHPGTVAAGYATAAAAATGAVAECRLAAASDVGGGRACPWHLLFLKARDGARAWMKQAAGLSHVNNHVLHTCTARTGNQT